MSPRGSVTWSTSYQNDDLSEENAFELQAGETVAEVSDTNPNTTQSQTTTFIDKDVGNLVTYDKIPRLTTNDVQDEIDLKNYFSRPVLISTLSWTQASLADTALDPWSLLLNNTFVKYKLNNFANIRGTLRIKVIVNSSPFYYGSAIAVYTPLFNYVPAIPTYVGNDLMTWSQRPHIWLSPQTNTGGELTLPFIWPVNYAHVSTAAAIADLGRLHIFEYVALQSANGATVNGCTIQVYAWLDNVDLKIPTVGLALQGDEYSDSPISRPASALANAASWFESIPVIGPFATATRLGAQAVSSIACLFGWSNPPVIEDVKPFKHVIMHDLASASISEPVSKITLDPKAELTVDPAVVGLDDTDELSISHLVQKDSYITSATWACDDTIGTLLFSAAITPHLNGIDGSQINHIPMSLIGSMFAYWRGDIILRFVVIASQYHRGRLRITWDPYNSIAATTDYSNVAFTKIVDLGDTTESEIRIPYAQAYPWLVSAPSYTTGHFAATYVANSTGVTNGSLTVRVLTNLSAPIDVAPVCIQVFARGAENLEFAGPQDVDHHVQYFELQGDTYNAESKVSTRIIDAQSDPMKPSVVHPERYLVNFGEAIPSLRTLLRRSCLLDRVSFYHLSTTSSLCEIYLQQGRRPPTPGYDPHAYTEAVGVVDTEDHFPYNFVRHTPVSLISPMFVCSRGGLRWHYKMTTEPNAPVRHFTVSRVVGSIATNAQVQRGIVTPLISATYANNNVGAYRLLNTHSQSWSGTIVTDPSIQPTISVEMSMMNGFKFNMANFKDSLCGKSFDNSNYDTYQVAFEVDGLGLPTKCQSLDRWVCAGTDFNLHFFLCCPVMYYDTDAGEDPYVP